MNTDSPEEFLVSASREASVLLETFDLLGALKLQHCLFHLSFCYALFLETVSLIYL